VFSKIRNLKILPFFKGCQTVEIVNHKTKRSLLLPPFHNQILKKNRELKMAAELGRKMLEENDGLRGMYSELEHEHEKTVKVRKLA